MRPFAAGGERKDSARSRAAGVSRGALYMLASALAFSAMTVTVKLAGQRLPSQEIVLARALVSVLLGYGMIRRAGLSPLGREPRWLLLRGVLGCAGLFCVFYSVTHLPLAEATVIQYLHPTFTALIAASVLGERVSLRTALGSAVSFLGVLIVAAPARGSSGATGALEPLALAAALGGAFFSAAAYTLVRKLAGREHPLVIVLWFPLVTIPLTLPTLALGFVWPRGIEWLWLLAVGVLTQAGQLWVTRGLELLPAARATAMSYAQVVFAIVWGVLFFGEQPGASSLVGALCVIGGTFVVGIRSAGARASGTAR